MPNHSTIVPAESRGAVLGALLGVGNGIEAFPERWIKGLLNLPPEIGLEKGP